MGTSLVFTRLDDDASGHARYSVIRDDKMGPCAYLHVDAGALEIVGLMQAAPELLAALKAIVAEAPDWRRINPALRAAIIAGAEVVNRAKGG